jgi:hypothetical protein
MATTAQIDAAQLSQWVAEKLHPDTVREQLQARGIDGETLQEHLAAFRKLRNSRKQFVGFLCCGIGAFLGFLACVLSLVNPIPELYGVFLYGFTSIAILVIFAGLYFIFE